MDNQSLSHTFKCGNTAEGFAGCLKGKSTLMIYNRHPELQSKWDKSFWAR